MGLQKYCEAARNFGTFTLTMLTPHSELKKIFLESIGVLLEVPRFMRIGTKEQTKDLHLFGSVDDGQEGLTDYFLLKNAKDGERFCEEDRAMCHPYVLLRIQPYNTESGHEITTTVILAYAAPRFLAENIAFRMLPHYDNDYLLLLEEDAQRGKAILAELFTLA